MTNLSVNINKIATLRNARGGQLPNVLKAAKDIEHFGAFGITVHPRPDERHITQKDAYELKDVVQGEYNIEGYPSADFIQMVKKIAPHQVTLVPDGPDVLTSNQGWDCVKYADFLTPIIAEFKKENIRVSVFLDPDPLQVAAAKATGTDRIELYTEMFAAQYASGNKNEAVEPYIATALEAKRQHLGINAGHDLNLDNLAFFAKNIPNLLEVSIGHALISDALYYGLKNTVQMYLYELERAKM
jgi:pyridoxine 5-phosphate synthase